MDSKCLCKEPVMTRSWRGTRAFGRDELMLEDMSNGAFGRDELVAKCEVWWGEW